MKLLFGVHITVVAWEHAFASSRGIGEYLVLPIWNGLSKAWFRSLPVFISSMVVPFKK